MKRPLQILADCSIVSLSIPASLAQVPIIQTVYTGDRAPMLRGDRLFLYAGHDEDEVPDNRFVMHEFLCFSTADMVNWTSHGSVLEYFK